MVLGRKFVVHLMKNANKTNAVRELCALLEIKDARTMPNWFAERIKQGGNGQIVHQMSNV